MHWSPLWEEFKRWPDAIGFNRGFHFSSLIPYWDRTDTIEVQQLKGKKEGFCAVNRHDDPAIIKAFGTATPEPYTYLLHRAPVGDAFYQVPVLLVHGAAITGNVWTLDMGANGQGLARSLAELGFRVFAITFSHPHGDNLTQAVQLADAASRICRETGQDRLDIVCYSKGGIACRCWLQGLVQAPCKPDLVRRICMLGVPNLGTDQLFRHPYLSASSHFAALNTATVYDKMWSMGMIVDTTHQSLYAGGTFAGQAQMLHRWAPDIPLDPLEPEVETTYYGGWTLLGHSPGIKAAIEDGGNLIDRLEQAAFEISVEMAFLAGNNNRMGGLTAETGAPSDGLVYVESALHTEPLVRGKCRLLTADEMHVNHLEMIYSEKVARWVFGHLAPDRG
ncbi:MAG: esterase/lipase family protein [Chitinophagales bacterium]